MKLSNNTLLHILVFIIILLIFFCLYKQKELFSGNLTPQSLNALNNIGDTYASRTNTATFNNIIAKKGIQGNLSGNVTGNVIGNVIGDVIGDVSGNITGNLISNGYTLNIDSLGNFNLVDASNNPVKKSWKYIGCYPDCEKGKNTTQEGNIERTLPNYFGAISNIDCQTFAQNAGYTYYALQDGGQCFAGDDTNYPTQFTALQECPATGGPCQNQVYQYI